MSENNKDKLQTLKDMLKQSPIDDIHLNNLSNQLGINDELPINNSQQIDFENVTDYSDEKFDFDYTNGTTGNSKVIPHPNGKYTKTERLLILEEIAIFRIQYMKSRFNITNFLMAKYLVPRTTAYRWYDEMEKNILKYKPQARDPQEYIEIAIERLEQMLEKAYESNQLRVALNIQQELNKLRGCYIEENKSEDGNSNFVIEIKSATGSNDDIQLTGLVDKNSNDSDDDDDEE